jgi:lysophospholipase L1-like esterase
MMIVGDSISAGQEGDYTWRYRLWQWFQSQKSDPTLLTGPVDFVGPYFGTSPQAAPQPPQPVALSTSPTSPGTTAGSLNYSGGYALQSDGSTVLFDSSHFAVWGRQVAQDKGLIAAQVKTYQPDMLLVELGFNDVGWFISDGQGTLDSMKQFIDNARSANPNLKFVIANIPQRTSLGSWRDDLIQKTNYYNANLPALARQWSTAQSPIVIADLNGDYGCDPASTTCDSTYDGLHPNELGEFRIAHAFEVALHDGFLPSTTVPPVPDISAIPTRSLGTPSNMEFDGTKQGATAYWSPVYGAYGYDVQWEEQAPGSSTWSAWNPGSYAHSNRWDKGWQFDGRPYEGYGYGIKVRANAGTGRASDWTAPVTGVAARTVSASPTNLVVTPISGGFNITWDAPTGPYSDSIYQYDVWMHDTDTTPPVYPQVQGYAATSATWTGLTPGRHYQVLVEAWNANGPSHPAISSSGYVPGP